MQQVNLFQIGFFFITLGFLVILIASLYSITNQNNETRFSFFGMLGFVPFGFSNDRRLFVFSILLTILFILFSLFFLIKGTH